MLYLVVVKLALFNNVAWRLERDCVGDRTDWCPPDWRHGDTLFSFFNNFSQCVFLASFFLAAFLTGISRNLLFHKMDCSVTTTKKCVSDVALLIGKDIAQSFICCRGKSLKSEACISQAEQ